MNQPQPKGQTEDFKSILTSHPVHPIRRVVTPCHGRPGKGCAFRSIFEAAKSVNAKACAVVDSDLRSITLEWVELQVRGQRSNGDLEKGITP
jgi:hypothetical protein